MQQFVRATLVLVGVATVLVATSITRPEARALAGGSPAAAALQAALDALNGVSSSQCTADGQLPPPSRDTCIGMTPAQATQADLGLVAMQAFRSPDIQPSFVLVGRGTDGAWGLWLAAPAAYVPVQLPGDARACGDGGITVRVEPDAGSDIATILPADTTVTVDRFVLTRPGTWSRDLPATRGEGWYHVSGPLNGWIAGGSLVVADGGCELARG
jgi:hypothetical protein